MEPEEPGAPGAPFEMESRELVWRRDQGHGRDIVCGRTPLLRKPPLELRLWKNAR